jgi:lincosamide nucleotidyltransferase A/C/D/E
LIKADNVGIDVWIAGGWGVDALLGRQTRPHNDFDIFVQKKDASAMIEIFRSSGYQETQKHSNDNTAWRNSEDHLIDFHLFEFTEAGTICIDNESIPSDIFGGNGTIRGIAVRCMTVESQVYYRFGYELREKDLHDVLLLCKAFGLPIPEGFEDRSETADT